MAYGYGLSGIDENMCYLYTSDNTCPSEFALIEGKYTARSMDDLVELPYSDHFPHQNDMVCYGKNLGKDNILKILLTFK